MKGAISRLVFGLPAWLRIWLETGYALLRQRIVFDIRSSSPSASVLGSCGLATVMHEISVNGYATIPAFKSPAWCAEAAKELRLAFADSRNLTEHTEDSRIFGIERHSSLAAEFAQDASVQNLASQYSKSDEHLLFCMANRVSYRAGVSYGSGGEWHRDGFRRELKALLYLTDVEDADGPFAIIARSHRFLPIVADTIRISDWLRSKSLSDVSATRLRDCGFRFESIEPGRAKVLSAPAGTLLLFDTSALHAGLPPRSAGKERLALTNYYGPRKDAASTLSYYRSYVNLNQIGSNE